MCILKLLTVCKACFLPNPYVTEVMRLARAEAPTRLVLHHTTECFTLQYITMNTCIRACMSAHCIADQAPLFICP